MIPSNPDRNQRIYEAWERGSTVDQTASELGIPRSTVGYYFRKFNRQASQGRAIVIPRKGAKRAEAALDSAVAKSLIMTKLLEILSSGRVEHAYYLLGVFKLMKDLGLYPTPEEADAFQQRIKALLDRPAQVQPPSGTRGPSLSGIFPEPPKSD
jgi:hypothetical protein